MNLGESFKNILYFIKKNKKIQIVFIFILIMILIYNIWYYIPLFIYNKQQKMNKINNMIQQENYDTAWNFIDRAFNGNEKIKAENMVLDAQKKQLTVTSKDTNPLDIINVNIDNGMLKLKVKNTGSKEINYMKYDIYYYSGTQGTGDIIGTDWSNSNNPIPSGAITEMETYIKIPDEAQSYLVKIREWN